MIGLLLLAFVVCLAIGVGVGIALTLALARRREAKAERDVARGPGPVVASHSPTARLQWPYVAVAASDCPGCFSSRVRGATFCHRCGRLASRSVAAAAPRSAVAAQGAPVGSSVIVPPPELVTVDATTRRVAVGEPEVGSVR